MKRHLRQRSILFLALVVLLVLSFVGGASSAPIRSRDLAPVGPTNAGEASVASPEGLFWCTIIDVWVISGAIGVNCDPGSGSGIYQYGYPNAGTPDSRQADRFLTIANTALVLNKRIWLGFNDSSSANPPGCGASTCRRVTSMLIEK